MEGSLDDLIRFLLEEIALCGEQGALPSFVLNILDQYIKKRCHDDELTNTVDRPFQNQVWKWLVIHPEIKVGRNGEGNRMGLDDVLVHNERISTLTQQTVAGATMRRMSSKATQGSRIPDANMTKSDDRTAIPDTTVTTTMSTSLTAPNDSILPDMDATYPTEQIAIIDKPESMPTHVFTVPYPSESPSILHVFASVDRMWLAVTGHGIDNDKIPALEFACLSVIAAHREHGILQPELVRVTGQDKRSVPWRTQSLCDKGYIIKQEVVASGARTSLCILRRFVVQGSSSGATIEAQRSVILPESINKGDGKVYVDARSPVIEARVRATFDILRELKIITWDDLKMKLGIWRKTLESKRFAAVIRKLEFLKCAQRVRASERKDGALHRCVKFLREPTEEELEMLCDSKHKLADFASENDHDDTDDDLENYNFDSLTQTALGGDDSAQLTRDPSLAKDLTWTPDRLMVNILRDAVRLSGTDGVSSKNIKDLVIGSYYERPIEHTLARLVEFWQLSQPLYLRHLAVLRDTKLSGKIQHYVYYSYNAFKSLVDSGNASWEAVETIKIDDPESLVSNAAISIDPGLDEYGFPKLDKARFQGRENDATLGESVAAAKIPRFRVTAFDASVSQRPDGSKILTRSFRVGNKKLHSYTIGVDQADNLDSKNGNRKTHQKTGLKRLKNPEKVKRPRGRPRKSPTAGLSENADSVASEQLQNIKISQLIAKGYGRSKIIDEIVARIQQGEEEVDSIKSVLADVAARNENNRNLVVPEASENLVNATKKRKRLKMLEEYYPSETYLPSVLAHSSLIPNLLEIRRSDSITPPASPESLSRQRKRPKLFPTKDNPSNLSAYQPSVPVHGFFTYEVPGPSPTKFAPTATLKEIGAATRKRPYRSRKFDSAIGYFPSIFAHTISILSISSQTLWKTKRMASKPTNHKSTLPHSPWTDVYPVQDFAGAGMAELSVITSVHSSERFETSLNTLRLPSAIENQSNSLFVSSGALQPLFKYSQGIPSILHKRNADSESLLVSQPASNRRGKFPTPSLVCSSPPRPDSFVTETLYLPSVAAHTHIWFGISEGEKLPQMSQPTSKQMSRPRKKTAKARELENMDQMIEKSIIAHNRYRTRPYVTYEDQIKNIARNSTGVHLGDLVDLKRTNGRGRPPLSRLIIFKSPRLITFSWFTINSAPIEASSIVSPWSVLDRPPNLFDDESRSLLAKPLLGGPRPRSHGSQGTGDFLFNARDTIRLSPTPEVSFSTRYSPIPHIQPPSVSIMANRKRKRKVSSTDTPRILRLKVDSTKLHSINHTTTSLGKGGSQLMVLPPPEVVLLSRNSASAEENSLNGKLIELPLSEEPNRVPVPNSRHELNSGFNPFDSSSVGDPLKCRSNIIAVGIRDTFAGPHISSNAYMIQHNTTDLEMFSNSTSGANADIAMTEDHYEDAVVSISEDTNGRSPTPKTRIALLAADKITVPNQDIIQDTFLQPQYLTTTTSNLNTDFAESGVAGAENAPSVDTANQTSTMARITTETTKTFESPRKDQSQSSPVPAATPLDSWVSGTAEKNHNRLSRRTSVTSDFKTPPGLDTISNAVVPNAWNDQEDDQVEIRVVDKDTMSVADTEAISSRALENSGLPRALPNDSLQVPNSITGKPAKVLKDARAVPTITRVVTTGGSVAVLRRKIIMDIIDKCGGVFPGDREIWQPFCDVWKSRTSAGKPDHRTVLAAVKYLVDNGKLRKLKFTINHGGVAAIRSILSKPDIPLTDLKIINLQQKMIEHANTNSRTKVYIPEEAKALTDPIQAVEAPIDKHHPQDGVNQSWANRLEVAEEQVKLQYPRRLKLSGKGLLISEGMERRRREREERILREIQEEMGEPDFEIEDYHHFDTFVPSEAAGVYEFRWREFDPATDEIPTSKSRSCDRVRQGNLSAGITGGSMTGITKTNSHRLMTLQVNSRSRLAYLPSRNFGDRIRQSRQNFNELRQKMASGAYPQIRFMEILGQHSNFDEELSSEPDELDSEHVQWLLVDQGLSRLNAPRRGGLLGLESEQGQTKVRKSKINKLHRIFQNELQEIGIQYRVAARRRRTITKPAIGSHTSPSGLGRSSLQIFPLMDQEHLFHVSTGTFSTSYTGMLEVTEVSDMPSCDAVERLHNRAERSVIDLPRNLKEALSRRCKVELVAHTGLRPDYDLLLEQLDEVKKWELGTPNLANTVSKDWHFINFVFLGYHETAKADFQDSSVIGRGPEYGMKRKYRRKYISASPRPAIPAKRAAPMSKPVVRRANLTKPCMSHASVSGLPADADGRPSKRITLRGPKLQPVSPDDDRRILIAVLIVRTLVGGSEQHIDWVLLARMFGSSFSERLLHRRWVAVRVMYKHSLEKLQFDFQDMFLQAYENGTIPPLDYDNYDDYDWNWLVDWTMKNLENPVKNLNKNLPGSRKALDSLFELRRPITTTSDLAQYYELDASYAVPKRHVAVHRNPQVNPIHATSANAEGSTLLDITRTWVRANVITLDEGYDAHWARTRLTAIGEPNIEAAVNDLLSAKVILQANKGRLIPGRNYDLTEYCLTRLRRKLEAHMFRQATSYKARLDAVFKERGSIEFSYHTQDAEVMAVLNLAAHDRIRILPKNPPMKPFGLVDHGYRTRHMDKTRLNFDIELRPTASYVNGNPLLPMPPPPGPVSCTVLPSSTNNAQPQAIYIDSPSSLERLPFWIGINNTFIPAAWDLALAAVLSLLAVRPGTSPQELAKTLRPALEAWEIALVLQWCVQARLGTWADGGAIKSENGGVRLTEWWWMALGEEAVVLEMDIGDG